MQEELPTAPVFHVDQDIDTAPPKKQIAAKTIRAAPPQTQQKRSHGAAKEDDQVWRPKVTKASVSVIDDQDTEGTGHVYNPQYQKNLRQLQAANRKLFVKPVPQEYNTEQKLHSIFAKVGEIESIECQPNKMFALIQFQRRVYAPYHTC